MQRGTAVHQARSSQADWPQWGEESTGPRDTSDNPSWQECWGPQKASSTPGCLKPHISRMGRGREDMLSSCPGPLLRQAT
ncbi:hypothetical protein NDU88_001389 [Pleurodeles waltl]|uniref:Uncharacterized protein n=1 Tax=Pleurodeles waltl TaxID=8319 RepID=A0AAV7MKC0_PLEWA|nr:hypothetical protein NDU88_001389 [Pleurodeles waltl]